MLSCREAQSITYADVTYSASTSARSRILPCIIGDGVRIRGYIVSHGLLEADNSVDTCEEAMPLSGRRGRRGDDVRPVDVTCDGFKEFVYVMWLGRRLHLQFRAAGQQADVAFRPGDAIKVSLFGMRM